MAASGDAQARAEIEELIGGVLEAAADRENDRRRNRPLPTIGVGVEDPIAWTKVFGYDANRLYGDPSFSFAQQLRQKLWRWEHIPDDTPIEPDVPLFLSYYPEYSFLGMRIDFSPEGIPNMESDHPLSRTPDVRLIGEVDFRSSGWMPKILDWHGIYQDLSRGRLRVLFPEWGRGCLDIAVQFRTYDALMVDAAENPAFVHDLLGFLTRQRCRWYEQYYRHTGRSPAPVGIADDWLNVPFISPSFFEEFVLPRYLEIERFHGGIMSVHSCGNQTPLQHALLRIGSLQALEVSPWTDLEATLRNVPAEKEILVSLHPNDVLLATEPQMREKLRSVVDPCAGRRYRIGTSGLTPISDDIAAFRSQIRRWIDIAREVVGH